MNEISVHLEPFQDVALRQHGRAAGAASMGAVGSKQGQPK